MPETAPTRTEAWSILVGDDCVVCGACASVCPTQALSLEDAHELTVHLHLDPAKCTHCETCLNSCTMDALALGWTVEEVRIVASSEWVRCKACGESFATRAELDVVLARLQNDFPVAFLDFTENFCPACKYKQA